MSENKISKWAWLAIPLRIVLAIFVFAPVAIALKTITKIGEILAEVGADFDGRWMKLCHDTTFLLHGKSLEQALKNAQELKGLREKIKRHKEKAELHAELEQIKKDAK